MSPIPNRPKTIYCSTHGEDDEELDRKAANDLYWKHLQNLTFLPRPINTGV